MSNIVHLARYREALAILATEGLRPTLYQLAAHVIDPITHPNPYGRGVNP